MGLRGTRPLPSQSAGFPDEVSLSHLSSSSLRILDSATMGAVRAEQIDDRISPFEEETLQEDSSLCPDQLLAQADMVTMTADGAG